MLSLVFKFLGRYPQNTESVYASPSADSATTGLDPPEGWTNDPNQMGYNEYWQGNDDLKATLEVWYDLDDPQPLCTGQTECGDVMFLFQSGPKYYIWSSLADRDEVWNIKEPQKLKDIYAAISKSGGGLGQLEMEELAVGDTEWEHIPQDFVLVPERPGSRLE